MGLTLSLTDKLSQQLATLTSQLSTAEQSIQDLKSSLDDLTASKKEHENRLITNFALVLNEKKQKIRNQQRLLEAAKVDPERGMLPPPLFFPRGDLN
jgi:septal ring factor EnvC (AmiA/AmiB activator)